MYINMELLPEEVLLHLFNFLATARDICALGSTTRALHRISTDESLWRAVFLKARSPHGVLKRSHKFGKTWLWMCKAATPFGGNTGVGMKEVGGTTICGQWVDGRAHGFAIGESGDGTRYEGDWRDGLMHGFGLYTVPGQLQRIGDFENDAFSGRGATVWDHGGRFVGTYANDVMIEGFCNDLSTGAELWGRLDAGGDRVVARCGKIVCRKRKRSHKHH